MLWKVVSSAMVFADGPVFLKCSRTVAEFIFHFLADSQADINTLEHWSLYLNRNVIRIFLSAFSYVSFVQLDTLFYLIKILLCQPVF